MIRIAALTVAMMASAAHAAEPVVGVVAPLSGPSRVLGQQVVAGAFAASRGRARLVTVDDSCTAASGKAAADRLVANKVTAAIGFLCTEALEAALPVLRQAGVIVITVGARTSSLTDRHKKTGWPLLRLAPRADGEAAAVGTLLVPLWREQNFAVVDDGTIAGRDLAEAFRSAAEQAGLKPVFVDTYRPDLENQVALVGRLRRAGATHVLVGGNRQDIAIIARDAAARDVELVLAGGENLRSDSSEVPLVEGTLMIGLPEWTEIATTDAKQKLQDLTIQPEGYVLPAYTAVEVAVSATPTGGEPISAYVGRDIPTAMGPIRFDAKGDLTVLPYQVYRWDGARFSPIGSD